MNLEQALNLNGSREWSPPGSSSVSSSLSENDRLIGDKFVSSERRDSTGVSSYSFQTVVLNVSSARSQMTEQVQDLTDRLKTLFNGTAVSEVRHSLKRQAEEAVEKLSSTRLRHIIDSGWEIITDFASYSMPRLNETQEEKEKRFLEYHARKTEELKRDDISRLNAFHNDAPSILKENQETAKVDIGVIQLDDNETPGGDRVGNGWSSVQEMKQLSEARLSKIKQRTESKVKEHNEFIKQLRVEGRQQLPVDKSNSMNSEFRSLIRSTPLTSDEKSILAANCSNDGDENEMICERFGCSITRRGLRTLNLGCWLIDEMINAYLEMCCARGGTQPDRPYLFSSFFLERLLVVNKRYEYAEVKRWTARGAGKADIFERRAVFWPINLNNTHWVLAVADMKFKRLTYYDSMGGNGTAKLEVLLQYLKDEHQSKKNTPLPDSESWKLLNAAGVPQQNNCNDCGVFTCTFANILMEYYLKHPESPAESSIFCFQAKDMPLIRQQMQLDIIRNAIYPLCDK